MITFKQFLAEARQAPLYHSTDLENLESIIEAGFRPRTYHEERKFFGRNDIKSQSQKRDSYKEGISLTRDFSFAKKWKSQRYNVIFEFDQEKLRSNYKITPIQYWQGYGTTRYYANEAEEFVEFSRSLSFKYVKHVYVSKYYDKFYQSLVKELSEKYGRDFIRYID